MLGAWMNFVITFFAINEMQAVMYALFGEDGIITSPFWLVAEGAIFGLIIDYVATRYGGEGKQTIESLNI